MSTPTESEIRAMILGCKATEVLCGNETWTPIEMTPGIRFWYFFDKEKGLLYEKDQLCRCGELGIYHAVRDHEYLKEHPIK